MKLQNLGVTPFEVGVLKLSLGAAHPMTYGALGFMNNARSQYKVPDHLFSPRFWKMCERGLLLLSDDREIWENPRNRRFKSSKRGRDIVAEVAILGGGDYHFYKTFDGSNSGLDKFLPKTQKFVIQGRDREIDARELFAMHAKKAKSMGIDFES